MNIPTLMTKVAALSGHPIPISSHPAPYDATDSIVVVGDPAQQISPSRHGAPDAAGRRVRPVADACRCAGALADGCDRSHRRSRRDPR